MKRMSFALIAAALTACSNASLPSSVTAPSVIAPSVGGSGGVASIRMVDPMQPSCPSEAPSGLFVTTNESGGAEAFWNAVPNAQDYVLEVTLRHDTNAYMPVDGFPVAEDNLTRSFVLYQDGRYQARVRARACGEYGNWSPVFEFSRGHVPAPLPVQFECLEEGQCYID